MKLTTRQIEPFLKAPDPKVRVVLIYGPDDGLMRARARALGQKIVADLNDPFNVSVLKSDEIKDDPARLFDEANAISMMGGARLVRIEDGKDGLAPALKSYLEKPSHETLVIIEAGDLGAKSALRKLCEGAKNAAALPCYVADAKGLLGFIRASLAEDGFTATPDALNWLADNISGDHGRVMSEIAKLKIYMNKDKRIDLSHVQAACGSGGTMAMDDFVYNLAGKNAADMLRAFSLLNEEGLPEIAMIRALQNHLRRLHLTKCRITKGMATEQAMKMLHPPVFFKYEAAFHSQLQRWTEPALRDAMTKVSDLEARCKQTVTPVESVCAQAFLSLARSR
jgi:DNA polymerase-3 subunit delta